MNTNTNRLTRIIHGSGRKWHPTGSKASTAKHFRGRWGLKGKRQSARHRRCRTGPRRDRGWTNRRWEEKPSDCVRMVCLLRCSEDADDRPRGCHASPRMLVLWSAPAC
jgi:hypothetical protein